MKLTMNITGTDQDLDRYENAEDLRRFYQDLGLDGLELMPCGLQQLPEGMKPEDLVGLHLRYYPSWLDFWQGNEEALDREYGGREIWTMYYGGSTREDFLAGWRQELELASRTGVRYVVFHVSECTLQECLTYRPLHSDREVCRAACEVINALLDGISGDFWFLVENLWWSGLTLQDPEIVRELMEGIHYPKKGIMLDTGHLLHTNRSLRTQEEGVDYIHRVLDSLGDLTDCIHGMHLNQSLSGEYVDSVIADPPQLTGTYWERLGKLYPHIYHIDYHEPFTAPGVAGLIRRLHPEFVTLELITSSREQHRQRLAEQIKALNENGGIR